MKKIITLIVISIALLVSHNDLTAQKKKKNKDKKEATVKDPLDKLSISALKFRSIGPANTSGRISDFAINLDNPLYSHFFRRCMENCEQRYDL
jgi:hypothetical protein